MRKSERLQVVVTKEMAGKIKKEAANEQRTVSGAINRILRLYFEDNK